MIDLYKNIRKFRIEQKMSQDTLAKLTGYTSRSSIAKIEKGEVDLPLSKIEAFADALNVDPSELMGDTWEDDTINYSYPDSFPLSSSAVCEPRVHYNATSNHGYWLNQRDSKQIEEILQQTKDKLTSQEGLMFDGDPASPEAIESILSAMEIGMEMAKKKNKEKYTPKKYKKD